MPNIGRTPPKLAEAVKVDLNIQRSLSPHQKDPPQKRPRMHSPPDAAHDKNHDDAVLDNNLKSPTDTSLLLEEIRLFIYLFDAHKLQSKLYKIQQVIEITSM